MSSKSPIERLPQSRVQVTMTYGEEQYGPAEARALQSIGARLNLKGFRPGHAPVEMVREKANQDQVFEETIRELLRESLPKIIEEHQLKPIMAPKVEAVTRMPLTLKIVFVEYPEVKVKSDKIKIEKKELKADPKDIQRVLDSVIAEHRTMTKVDRASKKGDRVIIDFTAADENGKDLPELKAVDYDVIIGEASLLPGFEDQLADLAAGAQKSFSITLPEKYQTEALRGKPVTFTVTVKSVEEVHTPELNDQLAKEKLNSESADAFKKMVEESILGQEQQFEAMRREREMMDLIVKHTEAEIAPEIVDEETRTLIQEWSDRLERQGLTVQEWMNREGKKPEEVEADMRKQAADRAKLRFGIAKLIEEKGISMSQEEIDATLADFVANVPEEHKADAQSQAKPGTTMYQEVVWRATVEKLMKALLA